MKQPSVYLKMRVLGAIDTAPGRTRHERVHHVAAMTFLDEEGNPRQFTWRTIQTWFYRYKNHGITGMTNHPARTRARPARSRPRNSSKPSTPPGPTSTTTRPTNAPSIASASRRACCSRTASPRPPSTASFASTTCSPPGRRRQQKTPRLQHEIRQPALAGRHHVRPLR